MPGALAISPGWMIQSYLEELRFYPYKPQPKATNSKITDPLSTEVMIFYA